MAQPTDYHELRTSRELLQAILDNTTAVVYVKDRDGRYILINRRYEELFHLRAADVVGKTDFEIWPPDAAQAFRDNDVKILERGQPVQFEEVAPHDDDLHTYVSTKFPIVDGDGQAWAVGGISTDITERKQAEQKIRSQNHRLREMADSERRAHDELKRTQSQLVQVEKLSILGQTVAGVAHEINNPLAYVSNNMAVIDRNVRALLDLVAADRPVSRPEAAAELAGELEATIAQSKDGIRRIQRLVEDLRSFARLDESERAEVDLNVGIRSTVNILKQQAKQKDVTIELELGDLPPVSCYPARINQVVLNLVANAIDASTAGATVWVRTRTGSDAVEIHVIDQGRGVDDAIRDRLFEPFFTTKPLGTGTGLGLSISHGIITEHGGSIDVLRPERGAHFAVRLPEAPPIGALPR